MFRLLDRHVVFEWLKILGLVVGATFGALVVVQLYDSYPDLRDFGASFGDLALYYAVEAPANLSFVVPIAMLVSLLYALGLLHRHNEITAMRAAGVSLFRITWWIWMLAAAMSALLFYLNSSVIPWSVEQSRLLFNNLKFTHQAELTGRGEEVGIATGLAYHNRVEGRFWMIARYSLFANRAFGVQLSMVGADGRETRRILASEGFWDETEKSWVLMRGRDITFDPASGEIIRPARFETMELESVHDDPRWMLMVEQRPKDLSFLELRRILASPETVGNPRLPAYGVRYHALMAGAFSCLIMVGLAVPFAVSGVRVNPAVGVSKSLGLFFFYYLLSNVGTTLGEQGTVPPWAAAWLPNAFMAGLAGWLTFRTR